ncbi:hypothetical protein [Serratia sp. OS31]|uniref:hypothetical protein n=1 Tax=Serratia sp. OS31 TaxID=2760844 RepID=UPI001600DDFD|nr:hypothetical protein [Serratia sp. OS31]MBB1585097.1 hypothetical protein [Serratia sp. OS31]
MKLDEFIKIVIDNRLHPDRNNIYSSALLSLSKNRFILGESVLETIRDKGFFHRSIYNHYLFNLYECPQFTVRIVFWQPVKLEVERNTFIYGLKHNHDFEIFIVGYSGDGYETTIYKTDSSIMSIYTGDKPKIIGRKKIKLSVGNVIHLRPFYDIHEQHPPVSLSSSLSLILRGEEYKNVKSWSFAEDFSALHSGLGGEEIEIFNKISGLITN